MDNFEALSKKIEDEYNKSSLFPFLAKYAQGCPGNKTETIKTEKIGLKSFNHVLNHPNTDLEKHYIKEILGILAQNELKAILPFLEKIKIDIEDSKENIIIGRNPKDIANADKFRCETNLICLRKKDIFVDDHEIVISDFRGISLGQDYDSKIGSFIIVGGRK